MKVLKPMLAVLTLTLGAVGITLANGSQDLSRERRVQQCSYFDRNGAIFSSCSRTEATATSQALDRCRGESSHPNTCVFAGCGTVVPAACN